ncbi:MAG: hypothetical protein SVK08_00430 [Halobacteriota archaeon]|nr:hypothetical protein [Halobacteriota archaeon]
MYLNKPVFFYDPDYVWEPKILSKHKKGLQEQVLEYCMSRGFDEDTDPAIVVMESIEKFGACHPIHAEELFKSNILEFIELLVPRINWYGDLRDVAKRSQEFCHTAMGQYQIGAKMCMSTYNAGYNANNPSYQGYQHVATDSGANRYLFFENDRNVIYNPFPNGCAVEAVATRMDYPDRMSREDHASGGNVVKLYCYLDGDYDNFAVWNKFYIVFMHLKNGSWRLIASKVRDIAPLSEIAQVGASGYSGILGMHTHVIYKMFSQNPIDPYSGPDNPTLISGLFLHEEDLLNLLDYPYSSRKKVMATGTSFVMYPRDYADSDGFYGNCQISVDGSEFATYAMVTPGEHIIEIRSEEPIEEVWFDRNPWGEWRPPKMPYTPTKWWKWFKARYKLDMEYPWSRNLLDYADKEFGIHRRTESVRFGWHFEKSGEVFPEGTDPKMSSATTEDFEDRLVPYRERFHYVRFRIESKAPDRYGFHTYYCINDHGMRSSKCGLQIVRK